MTKKHMASKIAELRKLGAASKQLSKKKKNIRTVRRCHIAMAYIVNDIWPMRERVLEELPGFEEFLESLMLLYQDCENGHAQEYIKGKHGK